MELASCHLFSISNLRCLLDFWTMCAFPQHDAWIKYWHNFCALFYTYKGHVKCCVIHRPGGSLLLACHYRCPGGFKGMLCGFCGGPGCSGVALQFAPAIYNFTNAPYSSVIRGCYSRPISGHKVSPISDQGTIRIALLGAPHILQSHENSLCK